MVEALYAVSTPTNDQYGQFWSRDQVNALVQPSNEAMLATVGWLNASGVGDVIITSSSVRFQTSVATANSLLGTTFRYYENSGVRKLRATTYSVHENVSQHIDFIHPTMFLGKPAQEKLPIRFLPTVSPRTLDSNCSLGLSPRCTKELYNISLDYTPHNDAGASIGFGSFLNQSAQEADQLTYAEYYGLPEQTFTVVTINGGVNNQSDSSENTNEANLDAQNIAGVSYLLPLTEYITGGSPPFIPNVDENATENSNEPYLQYYTYLLSLENDELPQVLSQSYGDDEQTVPQSYAIRVCNLIAMMGLRGITILEASGDTGVGAACRANSGTQSVQFTPTFPGTCPYLTAVGGTQDAANETAWVGSSGGFSNYFPRPSYQEAAVTNYLNDHVTISTQNYYSAYTNFSGRGYPDVAALSTTPGYFIYQEGQLGRNGGTSAAAPVWAGVIALINDARLASGKPALGWLNPWLYSGGYKQLRDITAGHSEGCNGNNTQSGAVVLGAGIIPGAYWNATEGWDPVTGWGVPNFGLQLGTWGTV